MRKIVGFERVMGILVVGLAVLIAGCGDEETSFGSSADDASSTVPFAEPETNNQPAFPDPADAAGMKPVDDPDVVIGVGGDSGDEGQEPEGGDPEGGDPDGGDPDGGDPDGGDPDGGDPEGGDPEGGDPEGGDPDGGDPEGGDPDGGDPEGGDPEGGDPEGGDPEGGDPDGGDPEGGDPVGGDPDAGDPEGGDPEGGDPEGGDPDGGDPEGGDPEGGDPEGGDPEGGDPEGGDPDGGDPEGGDPDGGDPEGGDPEGGDPEGGDPDGGDPEGGDPDGGDPDGGDPEGGTEEEELPWEEGGGWTWLNLSDAPSSHVQGLINSAVIGLGFNFGDEKGPRSEDVFLVNQHLLLWIDQSGFVGKMNGLWRLNGASGSALNFVVFEDTRPVNFLVVGENGNGLFPSGYPGGEHIEFPNTTPENNDNPACAEEDWCNQYAHHEATTINNSAIPWWEACNGGSVNWNTLFTPFEEGMKGEGVRLMWEAPLVKEADGDQNWDGDACHEHWLFSDGVRRPVYLQVGYELQPDTPYLDRIVRFRNPEGNPPFTGPMSVIGGFVISTFPEPHPSKEIYRWMLPTTQGFDEPLSGMTFVAAIWNLFIPPVLTGDWVIAWLNQTFGMSAFPGEVAGRTAMLSHVGASDNGDVGVCLCKIHGGLEMGGGLLHGGTSLPIDGGTLSVEARRRLELPGEVWQPKVFFFDAVDDYDFHETGAEVGEGWGAATADHNAGFMLYGPYTTDWNGYKGTASFSIFVDNNSADDLPVVTLDVFDIKTGTQLGSRVVTRSEFNAPFEFQTFSLTFDAKEVPVDHALEARVFWHDVSYVVVESVEITLSDE